MKKKRFFDKKSLFFYKKVVFFIKNFIFSTIPVFASCPPARRWSNGYVRRTARNTVRVSFYGLFLLGLMARWSRQGKVTHTPILSRWGQADVRVTVTFAPSELAFAWEAILANGRQVSTIARIIGSASSWP